MALTLDGDNGISGINGSAATPAVQGTDTNTGLTFGTDTVGVVTGGSTRFQVGSAGQFGIGGATYGSSGQFLQSQGASAAPQWATVTADTGNDYNFDSGSADSSSHLITGISSDAVKIVVNLANVGWTTGGATLFVRLGDSSGLNTTAGNYTWTSTYVGFSQGYGTSDSRFVLNQAFSGSAERIYGTFVLNRITNNAWVGTWIGRSSATSSYTFHGSGWGYSGSSNPVERLELAVTTGSMNTGNWNVNVFTE